MLVATVAFSVWVLGRSAEPGSLLSPPFIAILLVANLIPVLVEWWGRPTALMVEGVDIPAVLQWGLLVMAAGVFLSGLRDLSAAFELPYGSWPWKPETAAAVRR